jgi:hypothetical protein
VHILGQGCFYRAAQQSSMPKSKPKSAFDQVSVEETICVKGGRLKEPALVPYIEVETPNAIQRYVHLHANHDWLNRAVTGSGRVGHPMKWARLLDEMHAEVRKLSGEGVEHPSAADAVRESFALSDSEGEAPQKKGRGAEKPAKKPRLVKRQRAEKNKTYDLTFPAKCPDANPDDASTRDALMRTVTIWYVSSRSVFLSSEDLPWAIEYMKDQHDHADVPRRTACDNRGKKKIAQGEGPDPVRSDSSDARSGDSSASATDSAKSPLSASDSQSSEASAKTPAPAFDFQKDALTVTSRSGKQRWLKPEALDIRELAKLGTGIQSLDGLPYQKLKELASLVLERWAEQPEA